MAPARVRQLSRLPPLQLYPTWPPPAQAPLQGRFPAPLQGCCRAPLRGCFLTEPAPAPLQGCSQAMPAPLEAPAPAAAQLPLSH